MMLKSLEGLVSTFHTSLLDKFLAWLSNSNPLVLPSRIEEDVNQGQNVILACVPFPEVETEDCKIFSTNLLFAAAADEVELQFGTVVVEVVVVLVVVAGVGTQLWLSWLNTSAELFHSLFFSFF